MEIYEKVRRYLYENIGHMTTAGTPKYDVLENRNIPTKREMFKVAELEMERLPFLYYGTKKELAEQKIKPVAI